MDLAYNKNIKLKNTFTDTVLNFREMRIETMKYGDTNTIFLNKSITFKVSSYKRNT